MQADVMTMVQVKDNSAQDKEVEVVASTAEENELEGEAVFGVKENASVLLKLVERTELKNNIVEVFPERSREKIAELLGDLMHGADKDENISVVKGMMLLMAGAVQALDNGNKTDVTALLRPALADLISKLPADQGYDIDKLKELADVFCEVKCDKAMLNRASKFKEYFSGIADVAGVVVSLSAHNAVALNAIGLAHVPLLGAYLGCFSNPITSSVLIGVGVSHVAFLATDVALNKRRYDKVADELDYIAEYLEAVKNDPSLNQGGYKESMLEKSYSDISKMAHFLNTSSSLVDMNSMALGALQVGASNTVFAQVKQGEKMRTERAEEVVEHMRYIKESHDINQASFDKFIKEKKAQSKAERIALGGKNVNSWIESESVQAHINNIVNEILIQTKGEKDPDPEAVKSAVETLTRQVAADLQKEYDKNRREFNGQWKEFTKEDFIEELIKKTTINTLSEKYLGGLPYEEREATKISVASLAGGTLKTVRKYTSTAQNKKNLIDKYEQIQPILDKQKDMNSPLLRELNDIKEEKSEATRAVLFKELVEKRERMTYTKSTKKLLSGKMLDQDLSKRSGNTFPKGSYDIVIDIMPSKKIWEEYKVMRNILDKDMNKQTYSDNEIKAIEGSFKNAYNNSVKLCRKTLRQMNYDFSYEQYNALLDKIIPPDAELMKISAKNIPNEKVQEIYNKALKKHESLCEILIDKSPQPMSPQALEKLTKILPDPLPNSMFEKLIDKMPKYAKCVEAMKSVQTGLNTAQDVQSDMQNDQYLNGFQIASVENYDIMKSLLDKLENKIENVETYKKIKDLLPIDKSEIDPKYQKSGLEEMVDSVREVEFNEIMSVKLSSKLLKQHEQENANKAVKKQNDMTVTVPVGSKAAGKGLEKQNSGKISPLVVDAVESIVANPKDNANFKSVIKGVAKEAEKTVQTDMFIQANPMRMQKDNAKTQDNAQVQGSKKDIKNLDLANKIKPQNSRSNIMKKPSSMTL